jgi:hypothetical protein
MAAAHRKRIHVKAGSKTVLEAGTELTIKAGGSFIKIDPSGVYHCRDQGRVNSGGSPGSGAGARPLLPVDSILPEEGQMPVCQKVIFDQARALDDAVINECHVTQESEDA